MAKEKNKIPECITNRFMFFLSYWLAIKRLPPEEFKNVMTAICEKAFFDNDDIELSEYEEGLFVLIKPSLLKSIERTKICSEKGKKGGRPKKIKPSESQVKADKSQIKADETNLKAEKEEEEKEEGMRSVEKKEDHSKQLTPTKDEQFIPPSLEEVSAFCKERNNHINPESFIDYYSSNGWRVGSGTMKDWKAAIRLWEHREKNNDNMNQNHMLTNHYTSEDFAKLEEQLLEN